MKKILNKNLIFSILISILGIHLFLYKIYYPFYKDNQYSISIDKSNDNNSIISNIEIDKNFFASMSEKELIHYKILNSIDFFSSVEGKFNAFNIFFGAYATTYYIDIKNNKSYVITKSKDKNLEYIYNNKKAIEFDNLEKTYRDIQCIYDDEALANTNAQLNNITEKDDITANIKNKDLNKLKPCQRYDFCNCLLTRNSEPFYDAEISILSQGIMANSMADYTKWDIKDEEKFLDRICIKIKGYLNTVDQRSKSEKFTALIDKKTGIVLKYYEENINGEHTFEFETEYIKYNINLDSSKFILDYNKYDKKVFSST